MEATRPTCEDVFSRETSERIRREFQRLGDLCYLDQTSCALYSDSYIEKSLKDLSSNVYCNPHSSSTVSKHCTDSIDQVRFRILQHFNTDVDEYSVIFTSGATDSIKLLANCFKWKNDENHDDSSCSTSEFVYMEDNHTSILGMRDLVSARGAQVRCLSHQETLATFSQPGERHPERNWPTNSLFAYSAQCNFSGVKYPLSWIEKVHGGLLNDKSNWYCLLDAASCVSTCKLDLSVVQPDFVCISFYKVFGFPTGLGALLVKNKSAGTLEKIYYGGGTVLMALSSVPEHVPRPALHDRFEDGTLNYLSIINLIHGFNSMEDMIGDFTLLMRHCFSLAKYAFYSLLSLHHSNGSSAVKLYADTPYDDDSYQGNIVNFNMLRANGEYIGYAEVLNMANMHGIQLRTGCFCNPGACRRHLNLTTEDVRRHYAAGHVCGDDHDLVDGRPTGSVRISFGAYNTKNDVDRLLHMLETCFVLQPALHRVPDSWEHQSNVLRHKFQTNISKTLF
uniref:Aminotransferase class V domain-containing protein n=1 Tax=Lygus hesperus TaxID=30085 RepID=A0A0K8T8L6_LYGHE